MYFFEILKFPGQTTTDEMLIIGIQGGIGVVFCILIRNIKAESGGHIPRQKGAAPELLIITVVDFKKRGWRFVPVMAIRTAEIQLHAPGKVETDLGGKLFS